MFDMLDALNFKNYGIDGPFREDFDNAHFIIFSPTLIRVTGTIGENGPFIQSKPGPKIKMPLPKELSDSINISYTDADSLTELALGGVKGIADALSANTGFMGAVGRGAKMVSAGGQALLGATGVARIPEKMKNFSGLNASGWDFSWQFILENPSDYNTIADKIKQFKAIATGGHMAGGGASLVGEVGNAIGFYSKPATWDIELVGIDPKKLIAYPEGLVLNKIQTSFAGKGSTVAVYRDKNPVSLSFSISFETGKTIRPGDYGEMEFGGEWKQQKPAGLADEGGNPTNIDSHNNVQMTNLKDQQAQNFGLNTNPSTVVFDMGIHP
jgi:hypothetical protein